MDSIANPFAPNAGSRPPELVGRDEIFEQARILFGRTQLRRSAQSILLTGLRGVGKTVILNEMLNMAEKMGTIVPIYVEACEDRTLGETLASPLRMALLKLDRATGRKDLVRRGLSALRNFMGTIKVSFGDVGIELEPLKGVADSGDMQFDLIELLTSVAEAAADRQLGVVLLIDEIQYLSEAELGALVMALHRMQQRQLPLVLVGAGLPVLARLVGEAKSYAERLFVYPQVGALSEELTDRALFVPFASAGISAMDDARHAVCVETRGYPYFIQEWGSQLWEFIEGGPIRMEDVQKVRDSVWVSLDANFFRIRMERMTPKEKEFLRVMAEVFAKSESCRLADIAAHLGVKVNALAPYRASLIRKGMIYSPAHGLLTYTVPMFAEYLRRNSNS